MTKNLPQVQTSNALAPKSFSELEQFAGIVSESSFCPKDFRGRIADIIVAVQMGDEVGLKPIQSLHSIAVINGRPSIWGDAMVALVRSSGLCEYLHESYDEQTKTSTCTGKRRGDPKEQSQSFSLEDARKAGLLNKTGPWKTYTKRMIQWRARGFLLRDLWADVLKGLISKEEALDYPETREHPRPGPEVKKINQEEYIEPEHAQLEEKPDWEMTRDQSELIEKLIRSHVFSEDEIEKTKSFLLLQQTKIAGKKMIDRLLNLIKSRKAEEKAESEGIPFGGVRKDERTPEEIRVSQENTLADIIAGLDNCERAVDVNDYIQQVTGALLLLPDDMQSEFDRVQGEYVKNL